MLTDHSTDGLIGITPEIDSGGPRLRCLMFYEWETPFDERCLLLSENLLSEFSSTPAEGTGALTDRSGEQRKAHGDYKKVRAKLAGFLANPGDSVPSISVSGLPRIEASGFFPFAFEVELGAAHEAQKFGSFAVAEKEIAGIHALVDRAAPMVFGVLGSAYGGCWDFPAEYGAGGYVATVNTMLSGMKWGSNEAYGARLNRWRDNIWHRRLRARQGYFREIYPINFVLDAHLEMPFRGTPLRKFIDAEGSLQRCEFNEKMYRWDVPEENLNAVRVALEPSGLILSSEAEPLQIN